MTLSVKNAKTAPTTTVFNPAAVVASRQPIDMLGLEWVPMGEKGAFQAAVVHTIDGVEHVMQLMAWEAQVVNYLTPKRSKKDGTVTAEGGKGISCQVAGLTLTGDKIISLVVACTNGDASKEGLKVDHIVG